MDASRLLREGEAHLKKRAFAAAREALERAVTLLPALGPAHSLLGRARHGLGDAAGAVHSYRASLALNPRDADCERRLGNALLDLERDDEAADCFRRAAVLNPRDSGALYGLATALAERDDIAGAATAFAAWGKLPTPAGIDPHLQFGAIAGQIRLDDAFFGSLDTSLGPELDGAFAHGDTPILFAAADAGYTTRFVDLLAGNLAARAPGIALHLHVVNPTPESEAKVARAVELTQGHLDLAVTRETVDLARFAAPGLDPLHAAKTYYSCARFLNLPRLIQHYRRPVLVCDIDLAPTRDPRPWLDELAACDAGANVKIRYDFANKLLATMVYFGDTKAGRRYADLVAAYCRHFLATRSATWTIDQVALHAAWLHMRRTGQWQDFRVFAPEIMNWMDDVFEADEAQRRFLFVSLYSSVPKI
ncbi:MAG: tetratricopeptide repeat protein [Proteobacteria bacterium]|nr:tetratricopeptide repeat protein [Pseudomonadota bacterium]